MRGIGKPRAEGEEVALNPRQLLLEVGIGGLRAREAEPGVELVDLAVGGDTGIGLRHARAVEQRGFARIAGPGIDFHPANYFTTSACASVFLNDFTAVQAFPRRDPSAAPRSPAFPPPPARLVPAARPRPALAPDARPVSHPRLRGDAAADAGRSRAAEVPAVARQVPDAGGARGRAGRRRHAPWRPLGYNIRPRRLHAIARESVARYGGELPSDEDTLRSFKGIGAYTAGAVLSFAFGQRAAILDTNVARVLFRVFVGRGNLKSHAVPPASLDALAHAPAGQARLRLQPGADGFRRHGLHGAQAEMPDLPDARRLRRLSVQPRLTSVS